MFIICAFIVLTFIYSMYYLGRIYYLLCKHSFLVGTTYLIYFVYLAGTAFYVYIVYLVGIIYYAYTVCFVGIIY